MGDELSARVLGYGMLDRDHLTKHLLELAQRVGVEKVTMRGLAAQAGTSASSVYYHVAGKAELLDLLIEAVVNSIEVPAEGEWQDRVVALYTTRGASWSRFGVSRACSSSARTRPLPRIWTEPRVPSCANRDCPGGPSPPRTPCSTCTCWVRWNWSTIALRKPLPVPDVLEATFRDGLQIILTGLRHTDER